MNRGNDSLSAEGQHGPASRLHVVHGVLSMEPGGLERLVLDLIRTGNRNGYRSSVVCIDQRGLLAESAEALGAEVHCLEAASDRATAPRRARELFMRIKPDVLHTHQVGALWHLGRGLDGCTPVAVIHTEHSDHVQLARGWPGKCRSRLRWYRAGRLAHRFCCVSDDIASSARRWGTLPGENVVVVPNGVDIELFGVARRSIGLRPALGIPADAWVFGTVGRLNEVKQQHLLIRAFAQVLGSHPHTWLMLVGDGPERSALERVARQVGVAGRTSFVGYQSRTELYLAEMDAFVLSSRHEGLPLALLEAWASRLPVVSSAVGGIPRAVDHGRTGLLFDSGDEKGLAAAMRRLLLDPPLARGMAAAGRQAAVERYSLASMADRYQGHYQAAQAMAQGREAA